MTEKQEKPLVNDALKRKVTEILQNTIFKKIITMSHCTYK